MSRVPGEFALTAGEAVVVVGLRKVRAVGKIKLVETTTRGVVRSVSRNGNGVWIADVTFGREAAYFSPTGTSGRWISGARNWQLRQAQTHERWCASWGAFGLAVADRVADDERRRADRAHWDDLRARSLAQAAAAAAGSEPAA